MKKKSEKRANFHEKVVTLHRDSEKESPVKVRLAAINWERFRKPKAESSLLELC